MSTKIEIENARKLFQARIARIKASKSSGEYNVLCEDFICAIADGEFDLETIRSMATELVSCEME